MSVDLTRQNLLWTLVLCALLALLCWARWESFPVAMTPSQAGEMPLGALVDGFAVRYPFRGAALSGLCILLAGIFLSRIVTCNMILLERVYMPLQVFLIVACGSFFNPGLLSIYLITLLLVAGNDRLIESFRRVRLYGKTFNGAFFLGLMPLLYAPGAISLPVLIAALIFFEKRGREWIVGLGGYFLPFALCSYIYWGMGYDFLYQGEELVRGLVSYTTEAGMFFAVWPDPVLLALWGILTLITIGGLVTFFFSSDTMRTRPYKTCLFFGWMLLIMALLFVPPGRDARCLPLLAVPMAIFIPLFFKRQINWVSNLSYLLLLMSVFLYNALPFLS